MPSPVMPSQFKDLIPTPTDTLCQMFVKSVIKFPILLWVWLSYAIDESGAIGTSFAQDICNIRNNCP